MWEEIKFVHLKPCYVLYIELPKKSLKSAAPFFSPPNFCYSLFSGVYFSVFLLLFVVVYITHCLYTVPSLMSASSRPPANQDKYTYLIMMELVRLLLKRVDDDVEPLVHNGNK